MVGAQSEMWLRGENRHRPGLSYMKRIPREVREGWD